MHIHGHIAAKPRNLLPERSTAADLPAGDDNRLASFEPVGELVLWYATKPSISASACRWVVRRWIES